MKLCAARWIQRIDALHIFQSLHVSIVGCMEGICSDGPSLWSSDSLTDARSLIDDHEFLLEVSPSFDHQSQAEAKDIVEAVQEISSIKAALEH